MRAKLLEVEVTDSLGTEIAAFLLEHAPKLVPGDMHTPELVQMEFTRLRNESARVAAKLMLLIVRHEWQPLDLEVQAACDGLGRTIAERAAQ